MVAWVGRIESAIRVSVGIGDIVTVGESRQPGSMEGGPTHSSRIPAFKNIQPVLITLFDVKRTLLGDECFVTSSMLI